MKLFPTRLLQAFVPYLVLRYVQDRDLWHKALPHTEEVYAAMRSLPQEFEEWEKLYRLSDEEFLQQMIEIGTPILKCRQDEIEAMAARASIEEVAGYQVPVAYAPKYWSDVAHKLLEQYPQVPFAACWRDEKQENSVAVRHWELRSRSNEDFDVSLVAQLNGGGGHKHAAGFQTAIARSMDAGGKYGINSNYINIH